MLEQNSDIVLRNLRAKIEGNLFDEIDVALDYRYQHYLQILTRIEIEQKILTRQYYTNTGITSRYQMFLPVQLPEELLQAVYVQNSNHLGITKMI